MSKNLQELEVKVAFLEESLSQLSDEFYLQQKELNVLKSNYINVVNKLNTMRDNESGNSEVLDEKPPHY